MKVKNKPIPPQDATQISSNYTPSDIEYMADYVKNTPLDEKGREIIAAWIRNLVEKELCGEEELEIIKNASKTHYEAAMRDIGNLISGLNKNYIMDLDDYTKLYDLAKEVKTNLDAAYKLP